MIQSPEAEMPAAEGEASRKVLELKPPRRRKTDRNYQLLLKVTPAAAKRFTTLADAERIGFGEFLEHMLDDYEASRKRKDL
jgi:hypothetical protein